MHPTPTDLTTARAYVEECLAQSEPTDVNMGDALHDLWCAADHTWHVDMIDPDVFWAIIWANRVDADNADRAAFVRERMADRDMGGDDHAVADRLRALWAEHHQAHRTYAVALNRDGVASTLPFTRDWVAITPRPDYYARALDIAGDGDCARRRCGGDRPRAGRAVRAVFDVLVLP